MTCTFEKTTKKSLGFEICSLTKKILGKIQENENTSMMKSDIGFDM